MGFGARTMGRLISIPIGVAIVSVLLLWAWLPRTNVTVDPKILTSFAVLSIVATGICLFSVLAVHRSRNDTSRFGRAFNVGFGWLRDFTLYLALIPACVPVAMLSYLAVASSGQLTDGYLSAADSALGFDWLSFLQFTNDTPFVATVLEFCYHSFYWQFVAMPFVLIAVGQSRRLFEFVAAISLAALTTALISALVPAIGPMAYYHPSPDQFSAFDRIAGGWHIEQYEALRSGAPFLINKGTGLVAFPSFHTVLAILLSFAFRGVKYLRIPVWIVNAILVIGALPVGGHYLVDIIAGAVVALLALWVAVPSAQRNLRVDVEGRGRLRDLHPE